MCFTYIDDAEWNELSKQQRQLGWVGYFCSGAAAGFIGDTVIHCKSQLDGPLAQLGRRDAMLAHNVRAYGTAIM